MAQPQQPLALLGWMRTPRGDLSWRRRGALRRWVLTQEKSFQCWGRKLVLGPDALKVRRTVRGRL